MYKSNIQKIVNVQILVTLTVCLNVKDFKFSLGEFLSTSVIKLTSFVKSQENIIKLQVKK